MSKPMKEDFDLPMKEIRKLKANKNLKDFRFEQCGRSTCRLTANIPVMKGQKTWTCVCGWVNKISMPGLVHLPLDKPDLGPARSKWEGGCVPPQRSDEDEEEEMRQSYMGFTW